MNPHHGTTFRPLYVDPYDPVLLQSESFDVTQEQKEHIKNVLRVACSDSRFAEKAYQAIVHILTDGSVTVPVINSLNPTTAHVGDPFFDLEVKGSGFTPESVVIFNGFEEETTFVSEDKLTIGVNMPLYDTPAVMPVNVRSIEGVLSEPADFEILPAGAGKETEGKRTGGPKSDFQKQQLEKFQQGKREKPVDLPSIKPETNAPMQPEASSNPRSTPPTQNKQTQADSKQGKPEFSPARVEATKPEIDLTKQDTPSQKG